MFYERTAMPGAPGERPPANSNPEGPVIWPADAIEHGHYNFEGLNNNIAIVPPGSPALPEGENIGRYNEHVVVISSAVPDKAIENIAMRRHDPSLRTQILTEFVRNEAAEAAAAEGRVL